MYTILLGLTLLITTGLSWVAIGAITGIAGRTGISMGALQALTAIGLIVIGGGILWVSGMPDCSSTVLGLTCLSLFFCGVLNYFMLVLMGRAMRDGPNGVIWSFTQSALIFPFIVGVLFFGTALTHLRGIGIVSVLAALVLFGLARDNQFEGSRRTWMIPMFGAFLLAGSNQILAILPSYLKGGEEVGSIIRALAVQMGALTTFLFSEGRLLRKPTFRAQFRTSRIWSCAAILTVQGALVGFVLMFRGFDLLSNVGLGAICYPVTVISCILGFTIYSCIVLRERLSWKQRAGLVCGLLGIIFISLK